MLVAALVLLIQSTPLPLAQTPPPAIAGRVVTGTPARPLPGATVRGGGAEATTDLDGRFRLVLTGLTSPTAVIRITASRAGYLDDGLDVTMPVGQIEITLFPNPEVREDVVVSAPASETTAAPPTIALKPNDILTVAGAVDNVFRVLQAMPGVNAADDFGSRLSVRGGGPDQNLTIMDGVEIHNPYRLFGLTSAFNPETIDRFELTAGGFGAEYGDRLSSLLVVENRAGTTSRTFAGSTSLSATDTNVVLEGRLPARANGSWLVTGRRTYYDLVAERITHNDLPSFGDLQTKVVWGLGGGRQLSLFGLRSREQTDARFDGNAPGDTIGLKDTSVNDVVSATLSSPLGQRATSRTVVSWYRFGDALDVDGSVRNDAARSNSPGDVAFSRASIVFTRAVGARDVAVRQQFSAALGTHIVHAGMDAHVLRTSWRWRITGDRNSAAANGSAVIGGTGLPGLLDSSAPSSRVGVWAEDDLHLGSRVLLSGGLRADWSALAADTAISPRVRATVTVSPGTRLRLAAGRYTQSPGYEKLLQADYFVDLSNAGNLSLRNERSWHAVAGIERDVNRHVSARVEASYKTFDRLIVGRLETPGEVSTRVVQYAFPDALASSVPSSPEVTTEPTNGGSGSSYGFDLYVQRRALTSSDRLSGWVAYTWGRASIDNYGRRYAFDYDRRHALSLVATWRVFRRLDVASTLRIASGFPETQPQQLRVASTLADGAVAGAPASLVPRVDADGLFVWTVDNGGVENLNSSRLPVYARLDLRVTYRRSPASRWELYFDAINATNRENAGALSPVLRYNPNGDRPTLTFSREEGLPLLPSFGFRLRF